MRGSTRDQAPDRADLIAAVALVALVLLFRLPFHSIAVLTVDESAYMLVARDLLGGIWPGGGNFDHKPVATYYHYAAAMALGGPDPSSIRWLTTLSALATALTFFWILRRILALGTAWALGLTACWVFIAFGLEGFSANTEMIVIAYVLGWIAAFLAFVGGTVRPLPTALLSGIAAGIAVQINYLAGPLLAYLYLGALLLGPRQNVRWLLTSGVVSILVALALLVPLVVAGTLGAYLDIQMEFLRGYQGSPDRINWAEEIPPLKWQLAPLLALAFIAALIARQEKLVRTAARIGAFAATGAITVAFASVHLFAHYFHLALPGLFLVAASAIASAREAKRRLLTTALVLTAIPGFALAAGELDRGYGPVSAARLEADPELDRNRAVAQRFSAHVEPGSTGYVVCDQPVLYLLLDLRDLTDYPFWILHVYEWLDRVEPEREVAAIRAQRPRWLIDGRSCPDTARQMIEAQFGDYEKVDEYLGATLYRAPAATAPAPPPPRLQ
ncbi:hypothetical protein WJS89_04125 [Sphingomicrobium sp. XHP0235]|uniref:ArnT family glycosyltransferase n=1 Tax=Sphingomicrobium aquimarinum TaxID=3133971 RepID=UPI0031FF372D